MFGITTGRSNQFGNAANAAIGTAADLMGLKGKKFSIGARNSGTEHSNRFILTNLGIDPESLDLVFQGYGPTADSLQNGAIVGAGIPGGPPVSVITRIAAQMGDKVKVLQFTDEEAKNLANIWLLEQLANDEKRRFNFRRLEWFEPLLLSVRLH